MRPEEIELPAPETITAIYREGMDRAHVVLAYGLESVEASIALLEHHHAEDHVAEKLLEEAEDALGKLYSHLARFAFKKDEGGDEN